MTVYLGKNPVGVGRIVEKKVAKKKFGVTVDAFLGDVDADGKLSKPADIEEVNLAGVKSIDFKSMYYAFAGKKIKRFIANDVELVGDNGLWCCFDNAKIEQAFFDGIEELNGANAFSSCFNNCYNLTYLSFKKLKKISATGALNNVVYGAAALTLSYDEIFPLLEEVSGQSALNTGRSYKANDIITFSKAKKITGHTSQYGATFGGVYAKNTVWNFPSVTEITGYVWNIVSSYAGEIHFAAANQAAIEACDGYDYKWGFAGATIYFDL